MKGNRKSLKRRSGRSLLSVLLAAALTVGGMTATFAAQVDMSAQDEAVTQESVYEETTDAGVDSDEPGITVTDENTDAEVDSDEPGVTVTDENTPDEDNSLVIEPQESVSSGDRTETEEVDDAVSTVDEVEAEEEEPEEQAEEEKSDYDPYYGLYGGYDGQDSMNNPHKAGSCVGWDINIMSAVSSPSGLWWIDDYYIGESSQYDTEKTDDFSLKYQVEFHASEDLDAGAVRIVIDASLGTYRDGTNILPTDIGIPYGTPDNDNYTTTSSSPFNYYYIDAYGNILTPQEAKTADGVQIVVWNYRDIVSGSNAMFQVLYENLDAMQIYDGTEWSLDVTAEVNIIGEGEQPNIETVYGNTLSGDVDTKVTLNSVTKKAFTASGTSYTPELYTKSQVSSYINGDIPEPYASNFDDYIYIVWQVSYSGSATQAYEITIDESTFFQDSETAGSIVGFKDNTTTYGVSVTYGTDAEGNPTISFSSDTARSFSSTFYVVTAYSKEDYNEYDVLENDVDVSAHPVDGLDEDSTKSASAETVWDEYDWDYKGSVIGVTKGNNGTYSAYLSLYDKNAENDEDTGSFPFIVNSSDRGYGYTHYTEGVNVGQWIEGSCYTTTTVDDALYAYPNGNTDSSRMLTEDDYYFSSVEIETVDFGYDVWEDRSASPETYEGVDQDVYIYAMFYDADEDAMDEDGWEYVATVSYTENGVMTYTFTDEDLARQPYRVKVVHSTANYSTSCTISLSVMLRYDSPVIAEFEEEYRDDLESLKIENLCGVAGQVYGSPDYEDGTYFQDTSTEGSNYSEKDTETGETLAEFTEGLYGTIMQRDNANVTLTSLSETAAAFKDVSTENDTANGRILANYTITAYEGYYATGESTVDYLKEVGISLPGRNEVVYCDLLPYGMQFDASSTVTAGRITAMNSSGTWRTNPNAWDKTGVTVTVEESDIITNWNGTGRTMVIFHIHYDGDDASAFYDVPGSDQDLWYQGFGISFQTYYDWTEADEVNAEYNIAAYIVEGDELLGSKDTDIYKDDGSADLSDQYAPFEGVSDLNGDGVTDKYTNIYASALTSTNVATASTDDIKKTVRADADSVAEYGSTAVVGNGETYTYEITLTNNGGGSLSDVVIFDRLEYAVEDGRYEVESAGSGATVFDGLTSDQINDHWTGSFLGVTTTALDDLGIEYTIYYNADRNANVSSEDGTITPSEILNGTNGWFTEENFITIYGSLSYAKAIAVNLGEYIMDPGTTVSFQIHMKAPEGSDDQYAFNNPMYYSVSTSMTGDMTAATDQGDTVRVEIGEAGTLEVEKEFAEGTEIPSSLQNARFTFEITRSGQILANQEYMVYDWDEETQEWVSSGVISATDIYGRFTLRSGQKAVFSIVDVADVVVTEAESVLWNADVEEDRTQAEDPEAPALTYLFKNSYRSPVYFYKTALTTDPASDEELAEAEFTFRILVDKDGDGEYEPYANGEFLYVTDVMTNGSSPDIDLSKGEAGHGTTDENGYVTLHIGDIIVFFPCDENGNHINVPYQIIETDMGDDWINLDGDTVGGTTGDYGTSETIVNYYKYRNLILIKDLSDYDHDLSECEDEWTFRLTDANGESVAGSHWYMIDENGDPVLDDEENPVEGYLDENGEFSFTGAGNGRRVVIEELVEGEKYILTETNYDKELYETVNEGTADVTMPTYSITRSITITNKYLLKDLSVSKLVLSKDTEADLNGCEFTFTLEKYNSGSGEYEPEADAPYTIEGGDGTVMYTDENGQFILTSGQTALFDDIGYMDDEFRITETPDEDYPQIFPAADEDNPDGSYDARLGSDGDSVRFINGDFDNVVSLTKKLVGLDETGEAYVDIVESDNAAATLAGEEYDVPYTAEVTFGVYEGEDCVTEEEGELIDYDSDNTAYPFVYIKVGADGTYELKSYNGGVMTVTLAPYDYIYIAEIGSYTLKASESADMERILLDVTGDVEEEIGSDQILSEGDVMSGSAAANENIVLVNNISSANKESEIFKLMTEASEDVATGSQITFIVQIYDAASGTWSPASGIKYITMDGYSGEGKTDDGVTYHDTSDCWPTSGVLTTGLDGRITLTKTEDGYPYIRFVEDVVYANVYDDAEDGALRIIESESGTDEAWGRLAGYDGEGWVGGPALDITNADTFYNGNDTGLEFEVEKEMADGSDCDEDFTFYLKQIISSVTSPINSMDQILESEAGAGVSYDIFDVESGEKIGEGVTDADGSFILKPGQYARFYVPEDTSWYVYEGVNPGYPLYSAEANDDPNDRDGKWGYADNASIVDETNGVVQETTDTSATGTIILTLTDSTTGDPLAGGEFDLYKDGVLIRSGLVTDAHGQVIVTSCTSGEYYFVETSAPGGYVLPDTTASEKVTVPGGLQSITEYELSMENSPSAVKYAVKIWGIQVDTYSYNGGLTTQTAGLTFGPAFGADHLNSYVSRETVIENGGSHESAYCIHDMSWDEIIAQSKADPTVFADCRANGCTKAVELNLNDTLGNQTTIDNYLSRSYSGDGVSTLYNLLNYDYAGRWNYSRDGYSLTDPANVYSQSRVRVTLNGDSSDANLKYASETGDGSDLCDESNCLLSCFPEELQDAIVPRTVQASTTEYDKTTYDRLWLPARSEVGDSYATDNGVDYGIVSDDGDRAAYEFSDDNAAVGSSCSWWTRSFMRNSYYGVNYYEVSGSIASAPPSYTYGLSPCFCIE